MAIVKRPWFDSFICKLYDHIFHRPSRHRIGICRVGPRVHNLIVNQWPSFYFGEREREREKQYSFTIVRVCCVVLVAIQPPMVPMVMFVECRMATLQSQMIFVAPIIHTPLGLTICCICYSTKNNFRNKSMQPTVSVRFWEAIQYA